MTMKTLLVTNRKGGVGKTTTSLNIAAFFAKDGFKTLIIDLDTQGHIQYGLGYKKPFKVGIHQLLVDKKLNPTESIIQTQYKNLHLLPASINFDYGYDEVKLSRLSKILKSLEKEFDLCIVDTAPMNDRLLKMATLASGYVIVPMQTEYLGFMGAIQFLKLFYSNASSLNTNFKLLGIIPTLYVGSIRARTEVIEELTSIVGAKRILPTIRKDAKLSDSFIKGVPLAFDAQRSRAKADYEELYRVTRERINL